jgi:hypothetical protein
MYSSKTTYYQSIAVGAFRMCPLVIYLTVLVPQSIIVALNSFISRSKAWLTPS